MSHSPTGKNQKHVLTVNGDKRTSNPGCDVRDVQISLCVTGIKKKSPGYYRKFLQLSHQSLKGASPAEAQAAAHVTHAR